VIPRARVVAAPDADRATPMLEREVGEPRRLRALREEIDARLTAERLVRDAEAAAEAILAEARDRALGAVASAVQEAQESVGIELAAKWLALRQAELAALGHDGDRTIAMAVALAERLLGASLALDPALITDLARAVLDEARGARRAVIEAHPLDADELRRGLTGDGLDPRSIEVRCDEALARGELRLHTDLGTIDARLAPRFERLAAALRDALDE
jgi:flagellar biosynthesis/type III secretory pathway protein FliH